MKERDLLPFALRIVSLTPPRMLALLVQLVANPERALIPDRRFIAGCGQRDDLIPYSSADLFGLFNGPLDIFVEAIFFKK
jgi:hypothetical protein